VQPELIADCVHCGFCLPTCPTYALWHEEMDSPRGRIHLMDGLVRGTIPLSETVVEHFDRCLGCVACETACPSGVHYGRLIEQARDTVERSRRRPPLRRLARSLVLAALTDRRLLRAALPLRGLPAPGPLAPLKRLAPRRAVSAWPPEHLPGDGPRVALVAGCVQSVLFGDVNAATARVLQAEGYDVHVPRRQGCCGALHAHGGRLEQGGARARELARALTGYDHVVTNAAGCGSHLKDRGLENVVDVSELLAGPPRAERHSLPLRVALHDPCHLRHAQQLVDEPRSMVGSIPGLELLEPAGPELCCGSAGIYNVVQPQAAQELGRRTAARLLATEPDAVASANPGCLVQIGAALRGAGRPLPAFHPIELVDASIRGLESDGLLRAARS
jgi:glycolate oxidase iron-sulfur subunit